MAETRRYILGVFTRSYLLVFLPFLLIVSIIFIIQLSALSAQVNLKATELIQLFGYMLPEIFFYTIPFSLIAALANTFTQLSDGNELIALFSLGHTPGRILKILLPSLLLFSLLLLTLSILLYPQMKQKLNNFKREKISEATLNIVPNKLSQNFGNYHVFVEKKDRNGSYRNMVLFYRGKDEKYQLIYARKGVARNENGEYTLHLTDGMGETSDEEKVEHVSYRDLTLYQYPSAENVGTVTSMEFWKEASVNRKRKGRLLYLTFVALSPLLMLGIIAMMTFYNPRYRRGLSSLTILVVALLIYIPAAILQKTGSVPFFLTVVGLLILGNLLIIRRYILRRF
jgi:lipopolysaccharide export system permease protein